jgi:hypothetical protein
MYKPALDSFTSHRNSLIVCSHTSMYVLTVKSRDLIFSSRLQEFFESYIGNFMKEEREAAVGTLHQTCVSNLQCFVADPPSQEVILCNILDGQSAACDGLSDEIDGVVMH